MVNVLCEMKSNGLCRETENGCVHAVPHAAIAQRGGGTCENSGRCVLWGEARCLPAAANHERT